MEVVLLFIGFNSTMVRLKEQHSNNTKHPNERFQFHNGSIKSIPTDSWDRPPRTFQFHNGSIKRMTDKVFEVLREIRFNSTMVRLKAKP